MAAARKEKDGDSTYLWEKSFQIGQPFQILGYPVVLMEDMAAIAADSLSIGFGDFREAYTIVDRLTDLGQIGGGQVYSDAPAWKIESGINDGASNPFLAFLNCGFRETNDGEAR